MRRAAEVRVHRGTWRDFSRPPRRKLSRASLSRSSARSGACRGFGTGRFSGFIRPRCTVKERLDLDPQSGALFVFASKRSNRLKVLWFDHNGYCLLYKRLHDALFVLPEATAVDRPLAPIDPRTLAAILRGVAK